MSVLWEKKKKKNSPEGKSSKEAWAPRAQWGEPTRRRPSPEGSDSIISEDDIPLKAEAKQSFSVPQGGQHVVMNLATGHRPALRQPHDPLLKTCPFQERTESEGHSVMSNSLQLHGLYSPCYSPGQNTGVGSLSLLQGIFPTQGSNAGLLNCRRILYQLSHKGSPGNTLAYQRSKPYFVVA